MKIKYRVKSHEDFQKVVHSGKCEKSKSFVIYYLDKGLEHHRIGISAPVKLGNAVVRSTIRRQVRSMIREEIKDLNSYDFVIIVRKEYCFKTYQENSQDLNNLFLRIRRKIDEEK